MDWSSAEEGELVETNNSSTKTVGTCISVDIEYEGSHPASQIS
jgi:hypothetical protein